MEVALQKAKRLGNHMAVYACQLTFIDIHNETVKVDTAAIGSNTQDMPDARRHTRSRTLLPKAAIDQ
jgi:hypothetical protein